MMEKGNRIPGGTIDPLILDVYPHGVSQYLLNEDEGSTVITCQENSKGIEIDWNGKIERRMTILFRQQNPPTKVVSEETDGKPGVECQWKMDEDGSLRIQVEKTNSGRIRVER